MISIYGDKISEVMAKSIAKTPWIKHALMIQARIKHVFNPALSPDTSSPHAS
jgi:hypothetical protein